MKRFVCYPTILLSILLVVSVITCSASEAGDGCSERIARIVSIQGTVDVRKDGSMEWREGRLDDLLCAGDIIRVGERSRAAVVLEESETIVRLDQLTTTTLQAPREKGMSIIEMISGVMHFLSRVPRTLKVITPYVNASVEGTEFVVNVAEGQTTVTVLEGRVVAANEAGSVTLRDGQSAVAAAGSAPVMTVRIRPIDAVQWALYYPPVMDFRGKIPGESEGVRYELYRASVLLSAGRVDEANRAIGKCLEAAPDNSEALALRSVISLAMNDRERAIEIARRAVEADPKSVTALIALSYAEQAGFRLERALDAINDALALEPENSIALARKAELLMSMGEAEEALEVAETLAGVSPGLARSQTVTGFAHLALLDTEMAVEAFRRAIELDQADPLPRLGLGLALIRMGNLKAGRREIEIAASLDPGSSIIRSYLGKAYCEERRHRLAGDQYSLARTLDPRDPTPFFYDAIRKLGMNRPVEAFRDLHRSIELNDNRAVYRSRLLLDQDQAARSAGLARIYDTLGFQQLALLEGRKSVTLDPGNYSAHRFLSDSYAGLPRHEIARVSELLQAQLLQPINITPVQPQLAESSLLIFSGTGPGTTSFNEFSPLFNRNRIAVETSGVYGGNGTAGDEITVAGVHDRFSFSLGQFHYETDGYRENSDIRENIYNIFAQYRLTPATSLQAEYRYKETDHGDLSLDFDPATYIPDQREHERTRSLRLGMHSAMTARSDVMVSFIYSRLDDRAAVAPVFEIDSEEEGYISEARYLFHGGSFHLTGGGGYFSSDTAETTSVFGIPQSEDTDKSHSNIYLYTTWTFLEDLALIAGVSGDLYDGDSVEKDQLNPKLGVAWTPMPYLTFRTAVFRVLKRSLISDQTLEPTHVAGFNQFFDDANGTDAWNYGAAVDYGLGGNIHGGMEYVHRKLSVPFTDVVITSSPGGPPTTVTREDEADWNEDTLRAYLYWAPLSWMSVSTEYHVEKTDREEFYLDDIKKLETRRVPVTIAMFCPRGLITKVKAVYIDQEGDFIDPDLNVTYSGADSFWVFDATLGYRLPHRYGMLVLEARNLFDEEFRFQNTDSANPSIYPERLILARFTLSY